MAEEDIHDPHRFPSPGLISDDIISRVYEGGFKTWECAVDLARYLSKSIVDGHLALRGRDVHVIEVSRPNLRYRMKILLLPGTRIRTANPPPTQLGAGTAVPTSCLLFHVMQPQPPSNTRPRIRITVADYNTQVLALATIPNLLLTITSLRPPPPPWLEEGDFEPFAAQLADFRASLDAAGVRISAISGAWGPEFVRLLRSAALDDVGEDGGAAEGRVTLVLASETIYAPASLRPFAETLLALLRLGSSRAVDRAVALVAAKRVYFGVGGGVDEFLAVLGELGGEARCVWSSGEEEGRGQGVGRCILEVGLRVGG